MAALEKDYQDEAIELVETGFGMLKFEYRDAFTGLFTSQFKAQRFTKLRTYSDRCEHIRSRLRVAFGEDRWENIDRGIAACEAKQQRISPPLTAENLEKKRWK